MLAVKFKLIPVGIFTSPMDSVGNPDCPS